MNKKQPKTVKRTTLMWSILIALVVGGGVAYSVAYFQTRAVVSQAQTDTASMQKIQSVYETIEGNYYKSVSSKKITNGAIKGMISALNDPFSEYMDKSEATSLNDQISSSFSGIGAEVQKSDQYIKIISPIKGTPAKKAGLQPGDLITAVNGKSIAGKSVTDAVNLMRGKIGTKVTLTIKRAGKSFDQTLTRAKIPVSTVNSRIINKKIGYIQITSVSERTAAELKTALKRLDKKGVSSYILDVRDNPGGLMNQALKMSSMFLKNGKTIMQVQTKNGQRQVYKAGKKYDGGYKVTKPVAVLMNGGSASAAEIFAGALHQSANVPLIGTQSYGKGTVQTVSDFKDKSEMKITIAKWLTPNGDWINKKGLTPTYKADYPKYAYLQLINTNKTYQIGDVSTQIKTLQKELKALGFFNDKVNGYFGSTTKTAVTAYQKKEKLSVTGTANKKTILSIETKIQSKIAKNDQALNKAESIVSK
ncbi:S41 family peptidase [Pediococcus ethanolidurans]|uniref:Carboxy-terminal processing proteinase n=1 Tax=Pediococcus ethanolidurans TaxID=319653 RepID=A0A0R2JZ64_9LACO|nr:S41 family peptidase [Pediococcus ethanolidurans]KRN82520.1 carboxy-terminal processing proteinase [Pediococcus ethanolidurans]GEN94950.1 peptidase S41 [Pediococcus ethanolidurans]SER49554.1 carboxyl-terminal processing protease [Pediococcus ethanolidurans]